MSAVDPTFVFEGGKVYAIADGTVVAASDDADEVEEKVEEKGFKPFEKGDKEKKDDDKDDDDKDDNDKDDNDEDDNDEDDKKEATHIVTPNGLSGQILGRTPDIWGEEVTIRLENGRVAHLRVSDETQFVTQDEVEEISPLESLQNRLEEDYPEDRESLEQRQDALRGLKQEAASLITKGASLADLERLDEFVVLADHELDEINDAVRQLDSDQADAFQPPAPFNPQAVEQASVGPDQGGWLDRTIGDMVEEAEGTDYEKLMAEGPEVFVSELEGPALADSGVVRQMASSFIRSKTAAAEETLRAKYERTWLARIEDCRRQEIGARKTKTKKEASLNKEEQDNSPDDMLFG